MSTKNRLWTWTMHNYPPASLLMGEEICLLNIHWFSANCVNKGFEADMSPATSPGANRLLQFRSKSPPAQLYIVLKIYTAHVQWRELGSCEFELDGINYLPFLGALFKFASKSPTLRPPWPTLTFATPIISSSFGSLSKALESSGSTGNCKWMCNTTYN